MSFFRMQDNNLLNIDQIIEILSPSSSDRTTGRAYKAYMANGRIVMLSDAEAERLLTLIDIFSVPPAEMIERRK